jgi:hypothetical protein
VGVPRELDIREWRSAQRVGGVSGAWATLEAEDMTGAGVEFVLHARLASFELRTSTSSIDLVDPDGVRVAHQPYLLTDFELTDSYEPGQGGSGARSATIKIPGKVVSCASLLASGLMLAGEAEVSMAFDGCPYIERRVILDGDITGGVTFGALEEAVEFGVSDPSSTAAVLVTGSVVDLDRFPSASDTAVGQRYPLVFNQWGRVDCLQVNGQEHLICVSSLGLTSASFAIYVDGQLKSAADAAYGHTIEQRSDTRGQSYWAVTFTGSATIADESVQASVANVGTGGRYLHELVTYLLEAYTTLGRRRINYDLIGGIQSRIGSFPVAFLVNGSGEASSADAFSLCEDRIAKSFPMLTFAWVDGRYGPVVTDGRAPAQAALVEGVTLLRRVSAVQESDKAALVNRFTVRGGYDSTAQTYALVATRDATNSILCSRSAAVINTRDADVTDGDLLTRQADCEMVVDWRVFHEALPNYYVEFDVKTLLALRLRPGTNVALYVPSLGWDGVVGTITTRSLRRGVSTLGFRVWWANLSGSTVGGGGSSGGGSGGQ